MAGVAGVARAAAVSGVAPAAGAGDVTGAAGVAVGTIPAAWFRLPCGGLTGTACAVSAGENTGGAGVQDARQGKTEGLAALLLSTCLSRSMISWNPLSVAQSSAVRSLLSLIAVSACFASRFTTSLRSIAAQCKAVRPCSSWALIGALLASGDFNHGFLAATGSGV